MAVNMPLESYLAKYASCEPVRLIDNKRIGSKSLKNLEEAHPVSIISEFFWQYAIMELAEGCFWCPIEDHSKAVKNKLLEKFLDCRKDHRALLATYIYINVTNHPSSFYSKDFSSIFKAADDPIMVGIAIEYKKKMRELGKSKGDIEALNNIYAFCEYYIDQRGTM